ncbi:MAG: beta-propeller domain-containing protein, partial [Myxococcota bacterium]
FGKPNETVRGSLFDSTRKVVYAITAIQRDPLYAISIANPEKLTILSEIDGLSGDMNVFRFIGKDRKFLMAIGRDNSNTCTGFGSDQTGTNVAVSIIDVRKLSSIRLVQRRCVAIKGVKWVDSSVNRNLDQAHKMIGMYSDAQTNLLTVPVSYYQRNQASNGRWWWGEYKSAIGIMQWDLDPYDPSKDETQQNVLTNLGTIQHPKGQVKRTIIFQHQGLQQRMVLNLSETHISIGSLANLNQPQLLSTFELAPFIKTVYRFGKYIVEQVAPAQYNQNYNEFRVKSLQHQDLNDAPILNTFIVGRIQHTVRWKDYLLLFTYTLDPNNKSKDGYPIYDYQKSTMYVYDLSNPRQPVLRSSTVIPKTFHIHYPFVCGTGLHHLGTFGYNNNNSFLLHRTGLVSLSSTYDPRARTSKPFLLSINLQNPAKPSVQEITLDPKRQFMRLTKLNDDVFYLSNRTSLNTRKVNGRIYTRFHFYAQRWSYTRNGWTKGAHINIPGVLSNAYLSNGKTKLLTQDYSYVIPPNSNEKEKRVYPFAFARLHLLAENDQHTHATLHDSHSLIGWMASNILVAEGKLFLKRNRHYSYRNNKNPSWEDTSDHLSIFTLANDRFKQTFAQPIRAMGTQLVGVQNDKLFMMLGSDGLIVADVSSPAQPRALHFLRTLGWSNQVEFDKDIALVASGHFGIFQLNLKTSSIPTL